MPDREWSHDCSCSVGQSRVPTCSQCGAPGSFTGWSYRMHEAMGWYNRATGLAPYGTTGPPEDRKKPRGEKEKVMRKRVVSCSLCRGSGVLWTELHPGIFSYCPHCEGYARALDGGFPLVLKMGDYLNPQEPEL